MGQGRANSGAFVEIFSHSVSFGHVFMHFYLTGLLLVFYGFQFYVFIVFSPLGVCVCVVFFIFLSFPLFFLFLFIFLISFFAYLLSK